MLIEACWIVGDCSARDEEIEVLVLSEARHWYPQVAVAAAAVVQVLEEAHVVVSNVGREIQCFYFFEN